MRLRWVVLLLLAPSGLWGQAGAADLRPGASRGWRRGGS